MAEASDFKFGTQPGFARAGHKITSRRKSGHSLELGKLAKFWGSPVIFVQRLKLATSNLAFTWGLPRPTIKPQPEEKWVWPWAMKAPKFGVPV